MKNSTFVVYHFKAYSFANLLDSLNAHWVGAVRYRNKQFHCLRVGFIVNMRIKALSLFCFVACSLRQRATNTQRP